MNRAVFLDRDGVLNRLIWNPGTDAYESPHRPEDLVLCDNTINPLKSLKEAGYMLFIVSNQPSYAKGKTTLEFIEKIADDFEELLASEGVVIEKAFYCYHHPKGINPEYSFRCNCRKPESFFLLKAQRDYNLNLEKSWMIGDRDSDIECGQRAGCGTVLIKNPHSADHQGKSKPDYCADNLSEAVNYILKGRG
ncbi:MAG: HAD-IIIA family hydrolase [Nitrospirae bacterium]|nr:HAD-IIIA family hydrolase [Nitrospirota bacterium]